MLRILGEVHCQDKEHVETNIKANGHDYVDLGLSVKWATCNVGANNPEDYGDYYAWGEIETKQNYVWRTYKWCYGSPNTQTKYCLKNEYGTVDNKKFLEPADDVAHVKWGGNWRMPTLAEQDELRENCKWVWITMNGVKGYKVIGPNGNTIFLPASGYFNDWKINRAGLYGYYWSSSHCEITSDVYCLYINSSRYDYDISFRYIGRSVRPVFP